MRYLLDTNVLSELIRNQHGEVAKRIRRVGEAQVCTSVIVAAELRYGALKRQSAQLTERVKAILQAIEVLPFEEPAEQVYAEIRVQLEKAGEPISANDMLIAAQTMALGYTLVSDNEREFSRVGGLRLENWTRAR